ncbi:heterokaryon incompatibility protein-domain-containing protein [Echria macrotheca]|uniref:Heterokaryon incompatibility protein-domain-containing protein n=1 Tax=Echria macrotheca TaxID=438768 RepID=A0AAJ0BAY8_9PEZI|nr:heterokaryon incompatibility protein-domain-containing protein [Echria macrotheca]
MRLLNAKTLFFEEFLGADIPEYAILSHTWGAGEVTFTEMEARQAAIENNYSPNPKTSKKAGFIKIEKTAQRAICDGLKYVWVDTCCIDKTSSAELSEAINSMMDWYERAEVCYTHLADVPSGLDKAEQDEHFKKSRWFTRGWTLQELIAPPELVFLTADWVPIGNRADLADLISRITGVDDFLLTRKPVKNMAVRTRVYNLNPKSSQQVYWEAPPSVSLRAILKSTSIAHKMSWASKRDTTRVEDIAYCLLGIFDINMPLLYGEGSKAFLRLQEQILLSSDDQSLLAWSFLGYEMTEVSEQEASRGWGLASAALPKAPVLAVSPAYFEKCRGFKQVHADEITPPFSTMTNKGLRLQVPVSSDTGHPYMFLECQPDYAPAKVLAVPLCRLVDGTYRRLKTRRFLVDYRVLLRSKRVELYACPHYGYISPQRALEKDHEARVVLRSKTWVLQTVEVYATRNPYKWTAGSDILAIVKPPFPRTNQSYVFILFRRHSLADPSPTYYLAFITGERGTYSDPKWACGLIRCSGYTPSTEPGRTTPAVPKWDKLKSELEEAENASEYHARFMKLTEGPGSQAKSPSLPGVSFTLDTYTISATSETVFGKRMVCVDVTGG